MKKQIKKFLVLLLMLAMAVGMCCQYPVYASEVDQTETQETEVVQNTEASENKENTIDLDDNIEGAELSDPEFMPEKEADLSETTVDETTSSAVTETEKTVSAEAENENSTDELTWENVPSMGWDDPEKGQCEEQSARKSPSANGIALFSEKEAKAIKGYGIDVSSLNGAIDWEQVKAAGVDFAFIRVGGRGFASSGTLYKDDNALQNIEDALAAGIQVGVYFFSTAVNETEVMAEAQYTCNVIKDYDITYPVVYDCEGYDIAGYRNYGMGKEERTALAVKFLDYVESQGYEGMMYSSSYHFTDENSWLTDTLQNAYEIWVAQYPMYQNNDGKWKEYATYEELEGQTTSYTGQYRFWQCSSQGSVAGVDTNVDLNIEYYAEGEETDPEPTPDPEPQPGEGPTLTDWYVPFALYEGDDFSISGVIESASTISSVAVNVYDASDEIVVGATANPNAMTYDLQNLDSQVDFGALKTGIYNYRIIVTNEQKEWATEDAWFVVLNGDKNIAEGNYYIASSKNTDYSLSIKSDSDAAGANVHLWQRKDLSYMKFQFIYLQDGFYLIRDVGSGKYLSVSDQAWESGSNVVQQTEENATYWQIIPDGSGAYYLIPDSIFVEESAYISCLDLAGAKIANGQNIQIYELNLTQAQKWKLLSVNAASKPSISGATKPATMTAGSSFSVRGTINSDTTLTSVTVGVYNTNGTMVIGKTVNPNSKSYDLKNVDTSIKFGTLSAGCYRYKVTAVNGAGTTTLVSQDFIVLSTGRTVADGTYYIASAKDNNYVLSIKSDSNTSGANVHLWKKAGSNYMKFKFEYQSSGYYKVKDVGSGKYLGVAGQSSASVSNVEQQTNGTLWQVLSDGAGSYYLVPKCATSCVLDLSGAAVENGRNIQIYYRNLTAAQRWKLLSAGTATASKPTISGATKPSTMTTGGSFDIRGTISSGTTLTSVTVGVYNTSGSMVIGKTVNPNAKSYDLKNVDTSIKFGSLSAGCYRYKVAAVNGAGTTTLVSQDFIVLSTGRTVADGTYYIASAKDNNYVLSIKSDSNTAGANVHLWKKAGSEYMKFVFEYQSSGYYKIKDVGSGKYLGVAGQSSASASNVEQQVNGTLWQVLSDGLGGYYLVPKCATSCVLDLSGAKVANGQNIQVYNRNLTEAQRWKLMAAGTSSGSGEETLVSYNTTDSLNYRTGPGTSYSIAGTLSKGTTVQVVSGYSTSANGYTWYKIYMNGKYYYVCADYLVKV